MRVLIANDLGDCGALETIEKSCRSAFGPRSGDMYAQVRIDAINVADINC